VKIPSLHSAIKKLAGDIPTACSYIYDGETQRFIFSSSKNDRLEAAVVELDRRNGLAAMVDQSPDKIVQLPLGEDGRVSFIKRMATNLYFGICVQNIPESIQATKKVMISSFQDDTY